MFHMFQQTLKQLASLRLPCAVGVPLVFGYTSAGAAAPASESAAITPEFTASDRGGIPVTTPPSTQPAQVKDENQAEQGGRFGWPTDDESRFVARAQVTYAWIRKFGFDAQYT
jgi:hypothetical protein